MKPFYFLTASLIALLIPILGCASQTAQTPAVLTTLPAQTQTTVTPAPTENKSRAAAPLDVPKTQLLFTRGSDIYVINSDGSNMINLTKSTADNYYPGWAPDKKRIIFSSNRNRSWHNEYDIFVMNPDGSDITQITKVGISGPSFPYPSWSSDGNRIAFCKSRTSAGQYYRYSVNVMNSDGSTMQQLTSAQDMGSEACEYYPAWADSDKSIIYIFYNGFYSIESVGVGNFTGVTDTILSSTSYASLSGRNYMPHFSIAPDSKKIAYSVWIDTTQTTIIKDLASSKIEASTDKSWYADWPCWSPDGNSIAFGAGDGIYVMPSNCSKFSKIAGTKSGDTPYSWK
jgi:hypothetical protein